MSIMGSSSDMSESELSGAGSLFFALSKFASQQARRNETQEWDGDARVWVVSSRPSKSLLSVSLMWFVRSGFWWPIMVSTLRFTVGNLADKWYLLSVVPDLRIA